MAAELFNQAEAMEAARRIFGGPLVSPDPPRGDRSGSDRAQQPDHRSTARDRARWDRSAATRGSFAAGQRGPWPPGPRLPPVLLGARPGGLPSPAACLAVAARAAHTDPARPEPSVRASREALRIPEHQVFRWFREADLRVPCVVQVKERRLPAGGVALSLLAAPEAVEFDGRVDPLVDEFAKLLVVGDLSPDRGEVF